MKIKKSFVLSGILLALFVIQSSCTKERLVSSNTSESTTYEESGNNTLSVNRLSSTEISPNLQYNSVKQIIQAYGQPIAARLKNLDQEKLLAGQINISASENGEDYENLIGMNNAALNYLTQKYPSLGSAEGMSINDPDFSYMVVVYGILEENGLLTNYTKSGGGGINRVPDWLSCTVSVCLGYFDVSALINSLGTFEFSTVWSAVKFCIKKYVGWIGAALLLYNIVDTCF